MAGTPEAFQSNAFQNDAFQTGDGAPPVVPEDTGRLLPLLGVGFEWLFAILILYGNLNNS
jgi:hypothetical protein